MNDAEREANAKRLIDDPLLTEAFKSLEEELMGLWKGTGSHDVDQRESFWLALRLLDRLKSHLTSILETGEMARMYEKQHPHI